MRNSRPSDHQDIEVEQHELHEPPAAYARNTEIPTFFGQPMLNGTFFELGDGRASPEVPRLYYEHPHGEIWRGDAIAWLKTLESQTVDLIFADPPYNIKKAEWDTFESQEAYVRWSLQWIEQAARVLKPVGYTVALNKLDGIYYVDPRPEMTRNERLREQIADFQRFLVRDIWILSR